MLWIKNSQIFKFNVQAKTHRIFLVDSLDEQKKIVRYKLLEKYNYLNYRKSTFLKNLYILSLQLINKIYLNNIKK